MSKKRNLLRLYTLPAVLLCIPLVGNLISSEVNWSGYDFLIAAVMLWSTVGLIHLILNTIARPAWKMMLGSLVVLVLAAVWIELAVGIFGSLLAGN